MNTKNAIFLLWLLPCLFFSPTGFAAPATKPSMPRLAGDWSQVVGGIQGRLLVASAGKVNGTELPDVYLELRNVSDLGAPINVYYGRGEGVRLEVVDSQSKRVARDMVEDFDAALPEPYSVVLPNGSTLRLLVSHPGWGIPHDAGTLFQVGIPAEGPVLVPNNDHRAYFLRGVFSAMATEKFPPHSEWYGMLILPKVNITPLLSVN